MEYISTNNPPITPSKAGIQANNMNNAVDAKIMSIKNNLKIDMKGNIEKSLQNLLYILENDPYLQCVVFNELAGNIEITGQLPWNNSGSYWREADDSQLICYVDYTYASFPEKLYRIAVTKVVDDRRYHPIKNYFDALPPWDGVTRAETLAIDFLGAEDSAYTRAVTRKPLCACYRRIYHPGEKFDYMTVFSGGQGIGKSTMLAKLGMQWYCDSLSLTDTQDKTAAEKLQGYWLLEIGELQGMKKGDIDKIKAFISRQDDVYRASYGHRAISHPRQSVLFGTTNNLDGYLRDVTGNRRFWNITVTGNGKYKPWDMMQDYVDQIWAEVKYIADNEPLYLDADLEAFALKEQKNAQEQDDREGLVREYLDMPIPDDWNDRNSGSRHSYFVSYLSRKSEWKGNTRDSVSNIEIWSECFYKIDADLTRQDSYQIASIMAGIDNWHKDGSRENRPPYGLQRVYRRNP